MKKLPELFFRLQNVEKMKEKPKDKPVVHNLTDVPLEKEVQRFLSLGSSYIIRPKVLSEEELTQAIQKTKRRFILKRFFNNDRPCPPLFTKSKTNWTPSSEFGRWINGQIEDTAVVSRMDLQPVLENLSRTERTGMRKLKELIAKENLLIIESDKNMGLTLLRLDEYKTRIVTEIERLGDSFEVTDTSQIEELQQSCITIRDSLVNTIKKFMRPNQFKNDLLKFLIDNDCVTFKSLRGLPKLHKEGKRMRLLLPFHVNIFSTIHTFLAKVLQPIAFRMKTSLTSTFELIQSLEGTKNLSEDTLVVTADLENMYNKINRTLAIELVLSKIEEYGQEFFMFGRNLKENISIWRHLLRLAFDTCFFTFEDKLIKQAKGVPMGSATGPVLAIIYINGIIETNRRLPRFKDSFDKLRLTKLYIDDGFFLINQTKKEDVIPLINLIIQHEQSPVVWETSSVTIKTLEDLQTKPSHFLDMKLTTVRSEDGSFSFHSSVLTKELASYQYVHWRSAHPRSVKRAVIKGELSRRIRLSSSLEAWKETCSDLTEKLLKRSYPSNEISSAIGTFDYSLRRMHLNRTCAKILKNRFQSRNPFLPSHSSPSNLIPIVIRYDPRSHRYLRDIKKWMEEQLKERAEYEGWDFRLVIAYCNDRTSSLLSKTRNHRPRLAAP